MVINKLIKQNLIAWLLVLIWMIVIFMLSHQPSYQSSELSGTITKKVIDIIFTNINEIEKNNLFNLFNYIIRKLAHITSYSILSILIMNALNKYQIKTKITITLIISIIYAITDEIHQLFIFGRSGEIKDVLIDTIGIVIGILLVLLIKRKNI